VHYYQFNISDYKSHTEHLELLEDLAYRRMLDWCYLHESPLPKDKKDIARLIRMRTHCDCIAVVLREFFSKDKDGNYINKRIFLEINKTNAKSSKARESAKARWDKVSSDANALQTDCERNATQDTRHITQDTLPKDQPENLKVSMHDDFRLNSTNNNWLNDSNLTFQERQDVIKDFIDYWILDESKKTVKGWQMAFRKNPIVKRKIVNSKHNGGKNGSSGQGQNTGFDKRSRAKKVSDKFDELAEEAIANGEAI
jgi:uncharacterized protein YdaU (DUF1376 family)